MADAPKVTWIDGYDFFVYGPDINWYDKPGVYIFAFRNTENKWYGLYVGQADSFKDRLPYHERWEEAVRRGATHIHARVETNSDTREMLEEVLLAKYPFPMSVQRR